jgi:hypothetical protein
MAVQNVTLIKAHSNVLCAHSPVLAAALGSTWATRVAQATTGIAQVRRARLRTDRVN